MASDSSKLVRSSLTSVAGSARPRQTQRDRLRIFARCSGQNCPHSYLFWPRWLCYAVGVELVGRWYCGIDCAAPMLELRVHSALSAFFDERPRTYRVPLGLLLVKRGVVTYEQMRDALRRQQSHRRGRLGDWLRAMKYVDDAALSGALAQQWGCPVFPLERQPVQFSWRNIVPLPLFESARAVPAHVSDGGNVLHVAFCDRVDHTLLYGLEQILGCRTVACVATEPAVDSVLDHLRRNSAGMETCFDSMRDPREIAWIIGNYARELRSRRITMVRAGAFLWIRFTRGHTVRDLLFRILPERIIAPFVEPPAEGNSVPDDSAKRVADSPSGPPLA